MDWSKIQYFSPEEKWGNPNLMDEHLIVGLDAVRAYIGLPIRVHCGYEKRENLTSQHNFGRAVDCSCEQLSLIDFWIACEKFNWFNGLGLYPDWATPGLHLDTRPGPPARWGRIGGKYVALNKQLLKRICESHL
jgi:uncharacterized protein YcbK (DUF882 family)